MNTCFRIFATAAVAVTSVAATAPAYACPDYIMSCYAAPKSRTTTCTTYRDADGRLVTKCTSN
jgi:hypothetical protein